MLTLGSLFDGAGTIPFAAQLCGIQTLWSSEIEKYPCAVTAKRFPNVNQLGDIRTINGAEIEPVDIIAGGSPCQDLSVAGLRAGLEGERSGLFMEQIRVIKEMRNATSKRANEPVRPRYAVWENVPGAFSSNKGEDFRIVLEEFCKIKEPDAVIPQPPKGKWSTSGAIVGDGALLAQSWEMGIPSLGECSTLVFGESPSVAEESGLWQILQARAPLKYYLSATACRGVLRRAERRGKKLPEILEKALKQQIERWRKYGSPLPVFDVDVVCIDGVDFYNGTTTGKVSKTITSAATDSDHIPCILCCDARGNGDGKVVPTIIGDHNGHMSDYTAIVCFSQDAYDKYEETEHGATLRASGGIYGGGSENLVCAGFSAQSSAEAGLTFNENLSPTLQVGKCAAVVTEHHTHEEVVRMREGKDGGGKGALVQEDKSGPIACNNDQVLFQRAETQYIVRRLTPLECCRLQGMPDWWLDDVEGSDAARYKLWGNGMALPNALYIMEGIAQAEANE